MSWGRIFLIAGAVLGALAVGALISAGPPWAWFALFVPFGYAALLVAGVLEPRLAMFAPILCRGSRADPQIALTFDDGPHPEATRQVLAELAKAGARATFFVLGEKARRHGDVLREIATAGHDIGIHGDTHDRGLSLKHPEAIVATMERALTAVESAAGRRPTLWRPPIGHVSPRTALAAHRLGLQLVGWSTRSRDGRATTTAAEATRRVVAGLRPGAIILMHDAAEHDDRAPVAPQVLPVILAEAARRGLACVPLSQWVRP